MAIQEMSCRELIEVITDYLEGALPASERARFEAHLSGCDGCTSYLEQMRQTIRLTGELAEEHLDPEAKTELLAAFRDWKKRSRE